MIVCNRCLINKDVTTQGLKTARIQVTFNHEGGPIWMYDLCDIHRRKLQDDLKDYFQKQFDVNNETDPNQVKV